MTAQPPITCSLSGPELTKRLTEMRDLGRDALVSVSREGALRFRSDERTRERLEAIVAVESLCCPFLAFELGEEDDELVLLIGAPDGAEPIAEGLANAFASARTR
ncbi:MAG TPA: hypothetical protein VK307_09235 [Thermoleophilaceae bacterium]|nr:hypothetical protein [Thermoleophilaceae bacterium]